MRSRARLIAVLAANLAGASQVACNTATADSKPPAAGPAVALAGAPGKVTPVTNLFVATSRMPVPREQPAPWSLTASDGSGLALTRIDAKAVVEGPLAFTELHLYFHNPEARTRLQEELVDLATLGRRLRTVLLRDAARETLAE